MPYKIIERKSKYFVVDTKGKVLSKKGFPTKQEARKQEIAIYLNKLKAGKSVINFFQ